MKEDLEKEGVFVGSAKASPSIPKSSSPTGKVIPTADNKFSGVNSATFSGGSFIYVPKGVKQPLQAYFRINVKTSASSSARSSSPTKTLRSPTWKAHSTKFETSTLHSAVVELVALKNAKIQYITVQNWSSNVFNLVTKRGMADEGAEVKWIDWTSAHDSR